MLGIPKDEEWSHVEWKRIVPMNVAAVSRHWRALALSHAMLWTTFKYFEQYSPYPWNQLSIFSRRSDQAPLYLELRRIPCHPFRNHFMLTSGFRNHQHHCKRIEIYFQDLLFNPQPKLFEMVMKEIMELKNIPLLETLRLHCVLPVHLWLNNASSLTTLSLSGSFTLHFGDVPVLNLTEVDLIFSNSMAINDSLTLLRICSALITFNAQIAYRGRTGYVGYENICNPSLVTFCFSSVGTSNLQSILKRLHFPSLKNLLIAAWEFKGRGDVPRASALISRSSSLVDVLDLQQTKTDEVIRCLKRSPNLKHLIVEQCYRGEGVTVRDMINLLTLSRKNRLCPWLRSISFCHFDLAAYTEEIISMYMVTSRWEDPDGRSFKRMTFYNCNLDHIRDLGQCCAEGLALEIKPIGKILPGMARSDDFD